MKRLFLTALALTVLVGTTWATGQQEGGGDGGPVPLRFMALTQGVQSDADFDELYYTRYIEDKFNVELDWVTFPQNAAQERLNIALAAGELPDMIVGQMIDFIKADAIKAGVLERLNERIANGSGWINHPYWESLIEPLVTESDGSIYTAAVANLGIAARNAGGRFFWNVEWLEELGLEEPTTVDELHQALRAVQEARPDVLPISGLYQHARLVHPYWMNAFGLKSNVWNYSPGSEINIIDGEVVFSSMGHPNFRPFLEHMHMLFEEGLIDEEYFTQTDAQIKAKAQDPGIFLYAHAAPHTLVGMSDIALQHRAVEPLTSDYNPEPWWPERNPWRQTTAIPNTGDHVDTVFEIFDWMGTLEGEMVAMARVLPEYFNPELVPEGLSRENVVTIPPAESDSGEIVLPTAVENRSNWEYHNTYLAPRASGLPGLVGGWDADSRWGEIFPPGEPDPEDWQQPNRVFDLTLQETYEEHMTPWIEANVLKFTLDEQEVVSRVQPDLISYVTEMTAKFIMGIEPLDNYDEYLEELDALGAQELQAVYQAAYERMPK